MNVTLQENAVFHCSVDAILHPNPEEEKKRLDKTTEMWTMFRTYIKNGSRYEPRLCVGMALPLTVGDDITLIGDVVDTGTYGIQFQFKGIQKMVPTERNAVVNFLVNNVNGIGQTIAERIVDTLGNDVVNKIREDSSVLESIPGISKKRAINIKDQLDAMESSLEELQFFAKTGLGASRVNAIKITYGELMEGKKNFNLIDWIKKNPYQLITDVKGIGFKVADSVAINIGFPKDSPLRIAAGLEFVLKEEIESKGNIWMNRDKLIDAAASKAYLNISSIEIIPVLDDQISKGILIEENERIYLEYYYQLEFNLADKLHAMQAFKAPAISEKAIEDGIRRAERFKERELDDGQREAVRTCILNNLSVVTGGPGVGKTTTLDVLLHFLESECNMNVTMAAPTGRAAKRMTEQTGRPASTIHVLSSQKTVADFTMGAKRQVVVIDESSMVDINVVKMLLDLCHESTKLIFVGDVDQLPSIGPGQILRDMIESGDIATARLTKIHRQSADSHIITNAHRCINGQHLEHEGTTDFFIAEREDEEACLKSIINYVTKAYPNKLGVKAIDVQVLAPLRRGALGVNNLNRVLQNAINPPNANKKELTIHLLNEDITFREGDKVIQNKNDYNVPCLDWQKGVFNGEIGIIKEITNFFGDIQVLIEYQDKTAVYDMSSIRNVTLAYAITIHKSQGSEFPAVILPLFTYSMPTIYNRNLLYTAITRAKKYCCIVGKRETTNKMIHNNKVNKRNTTLAIRLNGEGDEWLKTAKKKTTRKTTKKSTKKSKT